MTQAFDLNFSTGSPGVDVASRRIGVDNIDCSERYRDLDWLQSHYDCAQHDYKRYDFDGRIINAGPIKQQPFIAEQAGYFIPLRQRRPSAPVRMAKIIVDAFTSLVFGDDRFPHIVVPGDSKSGDFKEALVKEAGLKTMMVQARNLGGAMGSVALSWYYKNGLPRVRVQNAKNLWVQEWRDRDQLIPAWVTQIYKNYVDEFDFKTRKYEKKWFWYRRDWTLDEEVVFKPVPYEGPKEPEWLSYLEQSKTIRHNDGICHVIWIQNFPAEEVDGQSDFQGQTESLESLDILNSVLVRGTTLNLDPTVLLKMDPALLKAAGGLQKGSDNALIVGEGGDASYMEIAGGSVDAGTKLFQQLRQSILEAAQCVIPDPNEVAAGSVSSVALKTIYRPMTSRAGVLRAQYGQAITRLLEQQSQVARIRSKEVVSVPSDVEGEEEKQIPFVALPPRVVEEPVLDAMGKPTGEQSIEFVDREPGESDAIDLTWPDWFPSTPQDRSQVATTLQIATGGKAFISKQSAVKEFASYMNRDPHEEWQLVNGDAQEDHEKELQKNNLFANESTGGPVDGGSLPQFGNQKGPRDESEAK
jgi:hypothetical protein